VLAGLAAPTPAHADTATLTVHIRGVESDEGVLGCRIFAEGANFPDGGGLAGLTVAIADGSGTCTFRGLAAGTYAVAVMHDANRNGKLDKNFVGIPTEGYGVSNNRTYAMAAPRWSESALLLAAGQTRAITVKLRY
jgi:uncharacterized protein (DUF2141 family)